MGSINPSNPEEGTSPPGVQHSGVQHCPSLNPERTAHINAVTTGMMVDSPQKKFDLLCAAIASVHQQARQEIHHEHICRENFLKAMEEVRSKDKDESPKLKTIPEISEDEADEKDEEGVEETEKLMEKTRKSLEAIRENAQALDDWHKKKDREFSKKRQEIKKERKDAIVKATRELNSFVTKTKENSEATHRTSQSLITEQKELSKKRSELKENCIRLQRDSTELQKKSTTLQGDCIRLKTNLAESRASLRDWENQLDTLQSHLLSLQLKLSPNKASSDNDPKEKEERKQLEQKIQNKKTEIEKKETDIKNKKEEIKLLEKTIGDKEQEQKQLTEELERLRQQSTKSQGEIQEISEKLRENGKILKDLKQAINNNNKAIKTQRQENAKVMTSLRKHKNDRLKRVDEDDKFVSKTYQDQMQNLEAMERDVRGIQQGLTNLKPLDEQKQNMVAAAAAQAAVQQEPVAPVPASMKSHSSLSKEFVAAAVTATLKTALGKDAEMTEGRGHDCMVVKTGAHTSLKAGNKGIQFVSDKNASQAEKDQNYDQGAKAFKQMFPNGSDTPMILKSNDPQQIQSMARAADKAGIDLSRIQDKNGNRCQKNQNQDGTFSYSFVPKPKPGAQQQEQQQQEQQQQTKFSRGP